MPAWPASSENSRAIGITATLIRIRSAYPTAHARNSPDRQAAFCNLENPDSMKLPFPAAHPALMVQYAQTVRLVRPTVDAAISPRPMKRETHDITLGYRDVAGLTAQRTPELMWVVTPEETGALETDRSSERGH